MLPLKPKEIFHKQNFLDHNIYFFFKHFFCTFWTLQSLTKFPMLLTYSIKIETEFPSSSSAAYRPLATHTNYNAYTVACSCKSSKLYQLGIRISHRKCHNRWILFGSYVCNRIDCRHVQFELYSQFVVAVAVLVDVLLLVVGWLVVLVNIKGNHLFTHLRGNNRKMVCLLLF